MARSHGELERRLGVYLPLLLLPRGHAAHERGDRTLPLAGKRHGEGHAHLHPAAAVLPLYEQRRRRQPFEPPSLGGEDNFPLRPLQGDGEQRIRIVDRRRERGFARDALRPYKRLLGRARLRFRIAKPDGTLGGKGVDDGVHPLFRIDAPFGEQRKFGAQAALALLLVGIGGKKNVLHAHPALGGRALCGVLPDLDAEGDEPFERHGLPLFERQNAEVDFPFEDDAARRAFYTAHERRRGMEQDVAQKVRLEFVIRLRLAREGMRRKKVQFFPSGHEPAARHIFEFPLFEELHFGCGEGGKIDARPLPPHGDVLRFQPHARKGGCMALPLCFEGEFRALFDAAHAVFGIFVDERKARPAQDAHPALLRRGLHGQKLRVRRKHRLYLAAEAALHRRLLRKRPRPRVSAVALRLQLHTALLVFLALYEKESADMRRRRVYFAQKRGITAV